MSEQEPEKKRRGRPPKVKTVSPVAPIQNSTVNASAAATEIAVVGPTQLEVGKVYKFMGPDIATDVTGKAILMSIVPFEVMKVTAEKVAVKFAFGSIEVMQIDRGEIYMGGIHVKAGNFAEYTAGLFQ